MIVHAFTCDHHPGMLCDWCEPHAHDLAGRLHRHEDGTVHRHGAPYDGPVEFLDDGPVYPNGKPEPYWA